MAKQTICTEPNCGGQIVNDICKKCRALYDDNPEEKEFLQSEGLTPAASILSPLSRRSKVAEAPTALADIAPVPAGMRRTVDAVSILALRNSLGSGLVTMPTVPSVDRAAQINLALRTPLEKRICSNSLCVQTEATPDEDGKRPRTRLYWPHTGKKLLPNCRIEEQTDPDTGITTEYYVPDKGFCRACSKAFNFLPIPSGTMIGQWRVDGPFAYGGDGFLYHGYDTELKVNVVIKAPHDANNSESVGIALFERDALVQMQGELGNVQILGFKEHEKQPLVIMERLDGLTLFDVRVAAGGPLPIEVGLSYFMAAVKAVQTGHEKTPARIFVDVKPQNFIVLAPGDRLKAIDYGGSQIEGKGNQAVVYTEGFSAPELDPASSLKGVRASKASDTFGLGRILCFLSMNFSLKGMHRFSLPTPSEEPLFAQFESLYRFSRRCLATNPDERMTLAEAYEQAEALRAEIVALKEKRSVALTSSIFTPDTIKEVELSFRTLPQLRIAPNDEAADAVQAAVGNPDPNRQRKMLEQILVNNPRSKEAKLRLASLAVDMGDKVFARRVLRQLLASDPFDCRPVYHLGRLELAEGDLDKASQCFNACYSCWPAEVAIKLAIGHVAELKGDNATASRYFETASWVNPDYTAGPFGWARCALNEGDMSTAIEAFNRVPLGSWAFKKAAMGKVQALIKIISSASKGAVGVGLLELQEAADTASFIFGEGESYEGYRLQADVLRAAITALRSKLLKADKTVTLLGVPLLERSLRDAASTALINCGRLCTNRSESIQAVSEAHRLGRFKFF
jgi:serine/threonine-protein kinase PknG